MSVNPVNCGPSLPNVTFALPWIPVYHTTRYLQTGWIPLDCFGRPRGNGPGSITGMVCLQEMALYILITFYLDVNGSVDMWAVVENRRWMHSVCKLKK